MRAFQFTLFISISFFVLYANPLYAEESVFIPQIEGDWWQIAGDPDLGPYTSPKQQPVDFGIWQAKDGTWQLWSCIRGTQCGGKTRLFHRWQGNQLTDPDWKPMGIAMQADTNFGEQEGGLQAPYLITVLDDYYLFYGDWKRICIAKGFDGKTFSRWLMPSHESGIFGEGEGNNARDPMVLFYEGLYYCYYTAHPEKKGAVYCRTSRNLRDWSDAVIVASGGTPGDGPYSSECPHVVQYDHHFYLFRTQRYGENAITSIHRSPNPLDFGVNDDKYLVHQLPIAAPEIIKVDSQYYVAALLPSLKGIQIAKLRWAEK